MPIIPSEENFDGTSAEGHKRCHVPSGEVILGKRAIVLRSPQRERQVLDDG